MDKMESCPYIEDERLFDYAASAAMLLDFYGELLTEKQRPCCAGTFWRSGAAIRRWKNVMESWPEHRQPASGCWTTGTWCSGNTPTPPGS